MQPMASHIEDGYRRKNEGGQRGRCDAFFNSLTKTRTLVKPINMGAGAPAPEFPGDRPNTIVQHSQGIVRIHGCVFAAEGHRAAVESETEREIGGRKRDRKTAGQPRYR